MKLLEHLWSVAYCDASTLIQEFNYHVEKILITLCQRLVRIFPVLITVTLIVFCSAFEDQKQVALRSSCLKTRLQIANHFYSVPREVARFHEVQGRVYFIDGRISYEKNNIMTDLTTGIKYYYAGKKAEKSIADIFGNRIFINERNNLKAYFTNNGQTLRVLPIIKNPQLALSHDRKNIFVTGAAPDFIHVLDISKLSASTEKIILSRIKELGNNVVSIAVDPLDGRIIFSHRIHKNTEVIFLMETITDPCINTLAKTDPKESFSDTLIHAVDEMFLTHGGNIMYENNFDAPKIYSFAHHRQLEDLKAFFNLKLSQINLSHEESVQKLKATNKQLLKRLKASESIAKQCINNGKNKGISHEKPKYPINSNKLFYKQTDKETFELVTDGVLDNIEGSGDNVQHFGHFDIDIRFGSDD